MKKQAIVRYCPKGAIMEFSKAYEYFKEHLSYIAVVVLDNSQVWITDHRILLQTENTPKEFYNKEQSWYWECSDTCNDPGKPEKCEEEAECCPNFDAGLCVKYGDCEKHPKNCGNGKHVAQEWEITRMTSGSIKKLLSNCPITEIKPDKSKQLDNKRVKVFTPIPPSIYQDTIVDMKYFKLLSGRGLKYYQEENEVLKEIYVKDKDGQLLGILMPLRG